MNEENTQAIETVETSSEGKPLEVISVSVDSTEKRKRVALVFSFIWTIISIIYSITMTAYLMSQNWVSTTFTIVLSALLAMFIIIVLVLTGLFFTDMNKFKDNGKGLKILGFLIKLFKAGLNITYVALTIIAIAGMAYNGMSTIKQWAVLLATLLVAVIKLLLVFVTFFGPKIMKRKFAKGTYSKTTFVNGKKNEKKHKKTNKLLQKLSEWSAK